MSNSSLGEKYLVARMLSQADERAPTMDRFSTTGSLCIHSPFDGKLLGELGRTPPEVIADIAATSREAQRSWAERPISERAAIMSRTAQLVLDRCDHILDTIQDETGKARLSAFEEVMDTARGLRVFARLADAALRPHRHPGAIPFLTRTTEYHHPVGVVGIITPWNYPFTLPATDAASALLAGNAVILKPDSQTPHTALLLADLFAAAGLPEGLFTVVIGAGSALGPALTDTVDYLMFTGSSATGRHLAAACAERLLGFSAELGGKNPLLVLPDADLEAAALGTARAAFANTGQLCISIERAYIHTSVYDAFVPQLLAATRSLRLGSGHDWDCDIGSLISEQQLHTVSEHINDAVTKGARILTGGSSRPDLGPYFHEPTILSGVRPDMTVFAEETFGPVLSIYRVDSVQEAIDAANDSRYGLNASIWSAKRGPAIATKLHTGTVNINDGYAPAFGSHHASMGGMGESGMGRRHGVGGIQKYTESQTVADQRLLPIAPPPGVTNEAYARALAFGIRVMNKVIR